MGMRRLARLVVIFPISILCIPSVAFAERVPDDEARRILHATDTRGGLVVRVGCDDGELTAALQDGDRYLVHGIDTDPNAIGRSRRHIQSLGMYGRSAVDRFDGKTLPYVDNLVNLLVVEERGRLTDGEIMRVLCPKGVAYVRDRGKWTRIVKAWPDAIDEWTHYLYDAGGNAASRDRTVGPPRHFQWIAEPRFSRSHDHLASVSAAVSASGRLFSIVDEGSIAFAAARSRWRLVARDAFNGVLLWQREIGQWEYHLRDFRSGPADIARRLIAVGEHVYVTLGYGEPVACLDAATGKTLRVYPDTEGAQEMVLSQGKLYVVLGEPRTDWKAQKAKRIVSQKHYLPPFERYSPPAGDKSLLALEASDGEVLWTNASSAARSLMPSTLAVDDGRVLFQNTDAIVCLDATTGQVAWEHPRRVQRSRLAWSTPTVVAHDGLVYSADRKAVQKEGDVLWIPSGGYHEYIRGDVQGELLALDATTGKRLWSCPAYEGFNAPVDILITGGRLWTGRYAWGQDPGITQGRDPKTGEIVFRRAADQEVMGKFGHARCHRAKATGEYLVLGRRGVEFVDVQDGGLVANLFVRGICQYGVLPANGLLYAPPHSCACSVSDLIKAGYIALAPEREQDEDIQPSASEALEQGPAFGFRPSANDSPDRHDWPTYRGDTSRSGATLADVPSDLDTAWVERIGGRLTSPVIAQNTVLAAEMDAHRLHALDAAMGDRRWTYTAGGRIDSPPTVDRGRVLFGSADGTVYCLRLSDGELIWRFRAAPHDRRIVANEQLESVWPVSGSVLVLDGAVYFAAGRTSYLDGGIFLYKLDAHSGRVLKAVTLEVEQAKRDRGVVSGGHLPDVLSAVDASIFMRSARFSENLTRQKDDVAHLWSSVGFLDDSWWHRTYWQFGTSMRSGWGGWPKAGRTVPAGRLLATDGERIVGFGRNQYDIPGSHVGVDGQEAWGPVGNGLSRWTFYRLFARPLDEEEGQGTAQFKKGGGWSRRIPVLARAMVLTNDTIFVAGPDDPLSDRVAHEPLEADPVAKALDATEGGRLLTVSLADGTIVSNRPLESPPVFDGMAAAANRLVVSTKKGHVICLAAK